mgnify:FL=1
MNKADAMSKSIIYNVVIAAVVVVTLVVAYVNQQDTRTRALEIFAEELGQLNVKTSISSIGERSFVICRFKPGEAETNNISNAQIARVTKLITDYLNKDDRSRQFYVTISGHTDKQEYKRKGLMDLNMDLSLRRAMFIFNSVDNALSQQTKSALPPKKYKILLRGFRDTKPLTHDDADNRRVEIGIAVDETFASLSHL